MYEAQSDNTISIMLGEKRVRFKAYKDEMLPMDYFSLGYCMSHSKCQWLQSLTGMSGLSKEKITMLCKGTAGPVKGNVIGLHFVSEYQSTNLELFFVEFLQLSLKLGLRENNVSCPNFPTLNVLEIDFYSQMGSIDLPVSLCSLTINCVTLEEKESGTIAKLSLLNYLPQGNEIEFLL